MKTENLVRALEKAGVKVEWSQRQERVLNCATRQDEMRIGHKKYHCYMGQYVCTFFDNEGYADNVRVRRKNDEDDSQSDYFAGWFCKTIKDTVRSLTKDYA